MPRYPGLSTFPGGGQLYPGAAVFPGAVFTYVFDPPAEGVAFQMEGRLFCTAPWGKSVWRIGGTWYSGFQPTGEIRAAADRFYAGGSTHTLSLDEVSDLTAAGFGAYITYEEVT